MSKRWIFSEASTLRLQHFSSSRTRSTSRETTSRTKATDGRGFLEPFGSAFRETGIHAHHFAAAFILETANERE